MSRVLLVFADPALGARLAAELTDAGHDARAVTSGERAMDRFIQEPSDVVVIDYDLEGRDGITTAEAIRWMPGGRRARVVLTSSEEPEDGPLAELAQSVDAFATLVGSHRAGALSAVVARAASVEPHTAETRVLSTEHVLLEAERRRTVSASSELPPEPEPATPREELTPADAPQSASDLDDSTLDEPSSNRWEWRDTDGRMEGREVRELAEEAPDTDGDFVGTFERMSFARVLHRMAERRANGALICVHPPDLRETTEGEEPTKVVYFRAGVPVHVRSNVLAECLGQVLARMRKIGPVALKESLKAMRRGEGRQGELLVEMGAIEPLELSEGLAQQMRLKLFELFAWRRGTFRFTAERSPPSDLIDLDIGLAEIAYLGLSATRDPQEMLALLEEHAHRYVIPEARKMVRFLSLAEERGLRAVIQRADGSRTVAEVLEGSTDPGRAAILLHAMECLDAVTLAEEPLRARAKPTASLPSVPSAVITLPSSSPAPISFTFGSIEALAPSSEAPIADDLSDPTDDIREEPTSVTSLPIVASRRDDAVTVLASAEALGQREEAPPARTELTLASSSASVETETPERDAAGSGLRAKPEGELDERVERLLKAERRFRTGQRALEKSSFEQALVAFEDAARLCPDEGHFVVHLAWARHTAAPEDRTLLERCIAEALRGCALAPQMASAHVLLARLLRAADRLDDARRACARALAIEPDHGDARRVLDALRS